MYVDLLFISEFFYDLLVLHVASCLIGRKPRAKRIIPGALTGAIVSTTAAILLMGDELFIINFILGLLLGLLMVWMTFRPLQRGELIYSFLCVYGAAFLIDGITDFLFKASDIPKPLIFIAAYLILRISIFLCSLIVRSSSKCAKASILINGKTITASVLIDTGNLLYDQECNMPVSIICSDIIIPYIKELAEKKIAFKSLGCTHGEMKMIYVPFLRIDYMGREYIIHNAPLGLSTNSLSKSDAYQMIISPDLIKNN